MKDTSTQGILTGATSEAAMIHTNRMSKMEIQNLVRMFTFQGAY
jgi:hypothetical protein